MRFPLGLVYLVALIASTNAHASAPDAPSVGQIAVTAYGVVAAAEPAPGGAAIGGNQERGSGDPARLAQNNDGKKAKKAKRAKKAKKRKSGELPPGLAKLIERRGSLPRGLADYVERKGALPPGLAEFVERKGALPKGLAEYVARKGALPPGLIAYLERHGSLPPGLAE